MSGSERRFDEEEARRIFEQASQSVVRQDPDAPQSGLTLRELQEIGSEVGLSADAISEAALALGASGGGETISFMGVPLGVTHSVALGRHLSDSEWDGLVARLRRTFNARGETEVAGGLRDWWKGNLRISLENTEHGDVLHMSTAKGGVRELMAFGASMIGLAAVFSVVLFLAGVFGREPGAVLVPLLLGGTGLGMIAVNLLRLPPWVATRTQQFESLAQTLLEPGRASGELQSGPASGELQSGPPSVEPEP